MNSRNKSISYSYTYKFLILFFSIIILFFAESSVSARQVNLQWMPNSEPDLSHYVIYWGTASRGYTDNSGNIGLATTYSLEFPDDGQIYYLAITANDYSGLESDFSNEVNTGEISNNGFPISTTGPDQEVNEGVLDALDVSNSTDLTGSWNSINRISRKISRLIAYFSVTNNGDQLNQPFKIAFYLSNDSFFDKNDKLIKETGVDTLQINESLDISIKSKLDGYVPGDYVIGVVDASDIVAENDETNNIIYHKVL